MKTIKALLKDIFYRKEEKGEEVGGGLETSPPINTNINPLKPTDHERKTDEVPGHPYVDNPDARKDPRISEELAEAYQRGLRDGRNSKIEETYFPTCHDGVPVFNGDISNPNSPSDFFSIAKSFRS